LAEQAGIPPGVLNIVTTSREGSPEIGTELATNPTVRKLSFTGSTPVGKLLAQQCASTVKKISLELGGNAPFIVFDDANIDAAVQGAINSKFRNAGQTCVCANRILVQDGVFEEFSHKFKKAVSVLKVGRGTDDGVSVGPLINSLASQKVERLLTDAKKHGAQVLQGGNNISGNFWEPTIITNINEKMQIHREEIFGPIAPLYRFKTEEEAIQIANDTRSGLAGYFYSRDIGRVWRVAEALEYGMVGVNEGLISNEAAPFGGIKESGIGREGSRHGLDEYSYIKYLCMGSL
jgi:succinate-semialdehyde dehydrogenase/glutarate-semialdehyde dehydrogenase